MIGMGQESQNSSKKGEQNQSSKGVWIIKTKFVTENSKVWFGCFVLLLCVCMYAQRGRFCTLGHSWMFLTFCFHLENVRITYSKRIDSKQERKLLLLIRPFWSLDMQTIYANREIFSTTTKASVTPMKITQIFPTVRLFKYLFLQLFKKW